MKEVTDHTVQTPPALHALEASHFQPYLGQDFRVRFAGGALVTAQLEKVATLSGYSPLKRKPFSILLQTGQQATWYPQAIYPVEHPTLGVLDLFLVPVGFTARGMQYEAVFS